jgi:hypothetical protein
MKPRPNAKPYPIFASIILTGELALNKYHNTGTDHKITATEKQRATRNHVLGRTSGVGCDISQGLSLLRPH